MLWKLEVDYEASEHLATRSLQLRESQILKEAGG